jgi:Fe-S oxidoreductase
MNPVKIVDSTAMRESLKISPQYRTWQPDTTLDFSGQGGFVRAVEMCSGMGECRKKLDGTMCPSYMGTLDEEHSTRGRANALRSVLSGKVPKEEFTGKRLYEVMDLCLECKACKAECPSNVDMAKLKYEFLDHYHRANGLPLRNRLFGGIERLNRIGSQFAPLSNWIVGSGLNRWFMENSRIDRGGHAAIRRSTFELVESTTEGDGQRGPQFDTFNNFNTPNVYRRDAPAGAFGLSGAAGQ